MNKLFELTQELEKITLDFAAKVKEIQAKYFVSENGLIPRSIHKEGGKYIVGFEIRHKLMK